MIDQPVLWTLQGIAAVATALGVCIAAYYYVLNLRNTQKNIKLTEETRKIQLLLDYSETREETYRSLNLWNELLNLNWESIEDYRKKLNYDNNPELYSFAMIKFQNFHRSGLMVQDGLMDIATFVKYNGESCVMMWRKHKEAILMYRKAFHHPKYLAGFEYLAEEADKYRIKMGWGPKTPNDWSPEHLNS